MPKGGQSRNRVKSINAEVFREMMRPEKKCNAPSDPCRTCSSPSLPPTLLRSQSFHAELKDIRLPMRPPSSSPTTSPACSSLPAALSFELTPPFQYDEIIVQSDASAVLDRALGRLRMAIGVLQSADSADFDRCVAIDEMLYLVEQAWSLSVVGREVAYGLCGVLKDEGGLDLLLDNVCMVGIDGDEVRGADDPIVLLSLLTLSQSMTVGNRQYMARRAGTMESLVRLAQLIKNDAVRARRLLPGLTGILECLFKESEESCEKLVSNGGLNVILSACRSFDSRVLRNCAAALANLAMYGSSETHGKLEAHKALDWLFPLAFFGDDTVSYYALIAVSALAANVELEEAAVKSGTLKLVEPFVNQHDPVHFGLSDKEHHHGQCEEWLRRLLPLLKLRSRRCQEPRILAAYHFVVESSIRKRQGQMDVFKRIGAVLPLKKVVWGSNQLASRLAAQALAIMGEPVPRVLSAKVPMWTVEDVSCWVQQIKIEDDVSAKVEKLQIDGDLLLMVTERELIDDLGITKGITRQRFLRELNVLRKSADYTSCDETGLANWLNDIRPDLRCYTYPMVRAGIDMSLLPVLTDKLLIEDCGITSGLHRYLILHAAQSGKMPSQQIPEDETDDADAEIKTKDLDVFISYRRSTGKFLAGLLKVCLSLHGLNVYLDIESLPAGPFADRLIRSIKRSKNFIIILTENSLDRCTNDTEQKDWIHKEFVAAVQAGCQIIPVMDDKFVLPEGDQLLQLPEDMRSLTKYHAVKWVHEFQDECIARLVKYIKGGHKTILKPFKLNLNDTGTASNQHSNDGGRLQRNSVTPIIAPHTKTNRLLMQSKSSIDCLDFGDATVEEPQPQTT